MCESLRCVGRLDMQIAAIVAALTLSTLKLFANLLLLPRARRSHSRTATPALVERRIAAATTAAATAARGAV